MRDGLLVVSLMLAARLLPAGTITFDPTFSQGIAVTSTTSPVFSVNVSTGQPSGAGITYDPVTQTFTNFTVTFLGGTYDFSDIASVEYSPTPLSGCGWNITTPAGVANALGSPTSLTCYVGWLAAPVSNVLTGGDSWVLSIIFCDTTTETQCASAQPTFSDIFLLPADGLFAHSSSSAVATTGVAYSGGVSFTEVVTPEASPGWLVGVGLAMLGWRGSRRLMKCDDQA